MKTREIVIDNEIAYIQLTKCHICTVNVTDLCLVEGFNWRAEISFKSNGDIRTVYAVRKPRVDEKLDATVRMHRVILNCPNGLQVDHINGNGLDNRRENLRIVTESQNAQNQKLRITSKSGYKGVFWAKDREKWIAQIGLNNKQIYLGSYTDIVEAVLAYENAALVLHKQYKHTG